MKIKRKIPPKVNITTKAQEEVDSLPAFITSLWFRQKLENEHYDAKVCSYSYGNTLLENYKWI